MKSFNHFDILAPYYDRFIKPKGDERFGVMCRLPANGLMLDAGGGTGNKSHHLAGLITRIIIADSSFGMLKEASAKESLVPVCSETEQLPFSDQSFARVIMVDALHHVANHRTTISELWRVLQPGGWIVIEEPDIRTPPVKIMAVIEKLALMRSHFLSPQRIADAFEYQDAEVGIVSENNTAWVVIHKAADIQSST
jgi:ubiquinone/menaquinone biosynthesis C-methylase UbiE